jgi:hypothetical protein
VAASFTAAPPLDHGPHYVRPDGTVSCPQSKRDHAVLLPRSPELAGRFAQLGADTDAVLAWLATC